MKRYYTARMMLFLGVCLILFALLYGCSTAYSNSTRPSTWPKGTTQPRKPVTHLDCDVGAKCRVYDSAGNRRYDLERP